MSSTNYLSFSARINAVCEQLASTRVGWSMTSDQVRERYDQVLWGACIKRQWVTWIPREDRWYTTPKVKEDWQRYDAGKDKIYRSEARMGLPLTSYFKPSNYTNNNHHVGHLRAPSVKKKRPAKGASAA